MGLHPPVHAGCQVTRQARRAVSRTDRVAVLAFVNAYLPGYKSGGPIQTIAGMVDHLGDSIDFSVYTADRDAGDTRAYPGVAVDRWQSRDGARVYYASPAGRSWQPMRRAARAANWQVLYLNSFFNPAFTLQPLALRRLRMIRRTPVVIAPRGELSAGALSLKPGRKRAFIAVVRALRSFRDVVWHASGPDEADEVRRWFGREARVAVAADLRPRRRFSATGEQGAGKRPGELRVAFLSRISPKKNVLGAIEALRHVTGNVQFDIYGPVSRADDRAYWERCAGAAATLPDNLTVAYKGVVPHPDVPATLAKYDLFFLPTLGENFGHAIIDALEVGCPVLLSDRTPWRNLAAARAGRDVGLDDSDGFRRALQDFVDMDHGAWHAWSAGARVYAQAHANSADAIEQNRLLFRKVLGLIPMDA
jgi:glycosyltransferase involved in cell wall biosynthesis